MISVPDAKIFNVLSALRMIKTKRLNEDSFLRLAQLDTLNHRVSFVAQCKVGLERIVAAVCTQNFWDIEMSATRERPVSAVQKYPGLCRTGALKQPFTTMPNHQADQPPIGGKLQTKQTSVPNSNFLECDDLSMGDALAVGIE